MTELPSPFRWSGDHITADLPGGHVLFTTRRGGVSHPPYDSLNLGPWTDDDAAAVDRNRAAVSRLVGRPLAGVRQVHGNAIVSVDARPARGHDPREQPAEADALVTDRPDVAVGVLVADCLPILVLGHGAVAAAHAGWRGLAAGVIDVAVESVRDAQIADHSPMVGVIGPGVGGCCYEVGDEVRDAFAAHGDGVRDGARIDLKAIAAAELRGAGVREVHDVGLCTLCAPAGLFFSHRRDGGTTGRQMGVAWRS